MSFDHPACFVRLGLALLAAASLASCSATSKSAADDVGSHDRRAGELREVMRGYDEAVRRNLPDGQTDLYDRWDGVFPRIADSAERLELAAIDLSGHPPGKLELPDRGRFQVLARSLAEAASQLKEAAARGDADAVPIARAEVGRACRDCHDRFRPDSPGVSDTFR